ncbi:MAG: hypothetical protein K2J90_01510 [Lachnospiraceae bacterium]|nr:hypothetical protein [Lachnospiraceae bacterium]
MRFLAMLFMEVLILIYSIGACRVLSMTFKTFSRSITIKNKKWAAILIAYKNTWGIATSAKNRNKISLLGVFSYIVFFPQAFFFAYDWWVYFTTGVTELCSAEKTYLSVVGLYYIIAVSIKIKEADNFEKGKIW